MLRSLGSSLRIVVACISAWLVVSSGGCAKREPIPTEKVLVAKRTTAPALAADMRSGCTAYWGEVHRVHRTLPDFPWEGVFEGRTERRLGLAETTLAPADPHGFVFTDDFIEAEVPTATWLCSKIGKHPSSAPEGSCAKTLRRTVASPTTLLAFTRCWQPDCPLAELRDGMVVVTTLPALEHVRVVSFRERQAALAWTHWVRSPEWTGSSLVVLHLSPPLVRAGEISLSEIDARDATKVLNWIGELEILEDGFRVRGTRSFMLRGSNQLSGNHVDEHWGFGADGNLVKQ